MKLPTEKKRDRQSVELTGRSYDLSDVDGEKDANLAKMVTGDVGVLADGTEVVKINGGFGLLEPMTEQGLVVRRETGLLTEPTHVFLTSALLGLFLPVVTLIPFFLDFLPYQAVVIASGATLATLLIDATRAMVVVRRRGLD